MLKAMEKKIAVEGEEGERGQWKVHELLQVKLRRETKHARILSFLSGQEESKYADQSGEITGILKEMCDEMSK